MTTAISPKRLRAAARQGFRCYYCGLPMWEVDPASFARRYRLSPGQLAFLRCTAEHLRARADGGGDRSDNIVAACWYCNSHRHYSRSPLPPELYRARVAKRMRQGKWLAALVPGAVTGARRGVRA